MGAKEALLETFIRSEPSLQIMHEALLDHGLGYKGSGNSSTLLYFIRIEGRQVGMAALRCAPPIFSFPATFWRQHSARLREAMASVATADHVPLEEGISSSQYSAGQIRINRSTVSPLIEMIRRLDIR